MIVCDACESNIQVREINVKLCCGRSIVVEQTKDLCQRCQNQLARLIKERVSPQPKPAKEGT
jgi:hypothetical protein